MGSKYDEFWRSRAEELRRLIGDAARGTSNSIDVAPIAALGDRRSWYGVARVRGTEVLDAQMAHLRSLANVVAETGLCEDESVVFTFTVDGSYRLRVQMEAAPSGQVSVRARSQDHPAMPPMPSATYVDLTEACRRVHEAIRRLEPLTSPASVTATDGLYFFFEQGQASDHAPDGRIVRIGNHPRAQGGLRTRLDNHYRSSVGAKNGSVFRRYIGGALLRRDDPAAPCLLPAAGKGHWERQHEPACPRCAPYEVRVCGYIAQAMQFRVLPIDDREERNRFEARLVATVATCEICGPSASWLGRFAYSEKVRASGLWNSEFVGGEPLSAEDLSRFEVLVDAALGSRSKVDLAGTLLIIPCCASKQGGRDPALPERRLNDFIGPESTELLEEGRRLSFQRTRRDESSTLRPALAYYTGAPYKTPGFRTALIGSIKAGLHCLIVSGGYGLLRPEEPIHWYETPLTRTRAIWSRRVPPIIEDYVQRNRIRRTFGAFSRTYASVVPRRLTNEDWRAVPEFDRERDGGSAIRVVPEQVGATLVDLLRTDFRPGFGWLRS